MGVTLNAQVEILFPRRRAEQPPDDRRWQEVSVWFFQKDYDLASALDEIWERGWPEFPDMLPEECWERDQGRHWVKPENVELFQALEPAVGGRPSPLFLSFRASLPPLAAFPVRVLFWQL